MTDPPPSKSKSLWRLKMNLDHSESINFISLAELNHKIYLNKDTGQIYMAGKVTALNLPVVAVRHGQTNGNLRNILQGQVDGTENQLNENGKAQAQAVSKKLIADFEKMLGINRLKQLASAKKIVVLTSPISRAKETAGFFISNFRQKTKIQLSPIIEELLKEISFGQYDGYAIDEIYDTEFVNLVRNYRRTQNATINWRNTGESFLNVAVRAKSMIAKINTKYADTLVIVFTHGTLISAMRTVLGDQHLLKPNGMIAFRDNIIENGEPFWFDSSNEKLEEFKTDY